jgi:hypothetical protein
MFFSKETAREIVQNIEKWSLHAQHENASICSLHEQFYLQGRKNDAQGFIRGHCDGL